MLTPSWMRLFDSAALLLLASIGFVSVLLVSCTPAEKAAAVTVLDISGAVCTELEKQPEPAFVYFTCAVVGVGEAVGPTFLAKVKREEAPAFRARTCPKLPAGSVAP